MAQTFLDDLVAKELEGPPIAGFPSAPSVAPAAPVQPDQFPTLQMPQKPSALPQLEDLGQAAQQPQEPVPTLAAQQEGVGEEPEPPEPSPPDIRYGRNLQAMLDAYRGAQGRLQGMLNSLTPQQLAQIMRGQPGIFGMQDLNRLINSGLFTGGNQQFLMQLRAGELVEPGNPTNEIIGEGNKSIRGFGNRIFGLFGEGEQAWLERILAGVIPGLSGEQFRAIFKGQPGIFGMQDLRRLIDSGLVSGDDLTFLQNLASRGQQPEPPGDGGQPRWPDGGGGMTDDWLDEIIAQLLESPGFDPELLRKMRTQAKETSASRERNELMRRGSAGAARGMFGSGIEGRAVRGIEQEATRTLLGALNQIDLTNAQAAQRSIDQALNAIQLKISREIGLGNLSVAQGRLALDAAIQQILLQLMILKDFFGDTGGLSGVSAYGGGGGAGNPDLDLLF